MENFKLYQDAAEGIESRIELKAIDRYCCRSSTSPCAVGVVDDATTLLSLPSAGLESVVASRCPRNESVGWEHYDDRRV